MVKSVTSWKCQKCQRTYSGNATARACEQACIREEERLNSFERGMFIELKDKVFLVSRGLLWERDLGSDEGDALIPTIQLRDLAHPFHEHEFGYVEGMQSILALEIGPKIREYVMSLKS